MFISCQSINRDTFGSRLMAQLIDAEGAMNQNTFSGNIVTGRSAKEMEVVKNLKGLDLPELRKFALDHYQTGEDIERPRHARAWVEGAYDGSKTLTTSMIDWGRRDHGFREAHPYIGMVVEDDRVRRSNSGNLRVSNGEDYFVDVYYDTDEFTLHKNNIVVRQRIRLSDSNEVRRLLIQSKIGGQIDPQTGLKDVFKRDIRKDLSTSCDDSSSCWQQVDAMDQMIKTGISTWSGQTGPIEAMQAVYQYIADHDPSALVGADKELKLKGMAAVMSRRARYHLNRMSRNIMERRLRHGKTVFEQLIAPLENSNLADKAELIELAKNLPNDSYILEQITPILQGLGLNSDFENFIPGKRPDIDSLIDAERAKRAARYLSDAYHDFARRAEDLEDTFPEAEDMLRQIEAAGSIAKALWLNSTEEYITGSVSTSNLIIDTFDYAQMMSADEFRNLSNDEVRWQNFFDADLDKYQVLAASIVNEVQIELTRIKSFTDVIENSTGGKKELAEEILGYYQNIQEDLALRRFEKLEEVAADEGLPSVSWGNPDGSKGFIAIKAVMDHQPTISPSASPVASPVSVP